MTDESDTNDVESDDEGGAVQATLRVMPADADIDLDDLETRIEDAVEDTVSLGETERDAVAFGLEALLVPIRVPDGEGGADAVAETVEELDGVESVRVDSVTRV